MPPKSSESNSDWAWRMLSKPLEKGDSENYGEVLQRRNPLAFGHFANHPPKGSTPNVMICPYDFLLTEKDMRVYIPNITFGGEEPITMKRFGSFWFKSGGSGNQAGESPVLKMLVLVSARSICDEELFANYMYSSSKARPEWYTQVDEEDSPEYKVHTFGGEEPITMIRVDGASFAHLSCTILPAIFF